LLEAEFAKVRGSKTFGRLIIETWIDILRQRIAKSGDFEPLFEYVLSTTTGIHLGKRLFASQRRQAFCERLKKAIQTSTVNEKNRPY
jgi:hypothetical protein